MANDSVENTVVCFFNKKFKTPPALDIHKLIFEEIKLDKRDVKSIRFDYERNSLSLKLANGELCEKFARECNGILKFCHVDGKVSDVVVMVVGYGIRKIKVFNLPFEIPDEEISKCLSIYGSVMTVTRDKWPKTFPFPVFNGVRTVKINLWKHIPSFKYVCGYRAFISYCGQPETCSICNAVGHFRKQCPRKRPVWLADDGWLAIGTTGQTQLLHANGGQRGRADAATDPREKETGVAILRATAVPAVTVGGRRRRRPVLRKRAA